MTKSNCSGKIYNCHVNKEVFEMFYDKQQAINACSTDPSLIFNVIKHGYYDVVEILIDKNKVDVRFAFCFPDVYEIGMSNLGLKCCYKIVEG